MPNNNSWYNDLMRVLDAQSSLNNIYLKTILIYFIIKVFAYLLKF